MPIQYSPDRDKALLRRLNGRAVIGLYIALWLGPAGGSAHSEPPHTLDSRRAASRHFPLPFSGPVVAFPLPSWRLEDVVDAIVYVVRFQVFVWQRVCFSLMHWVVPGLYLFPRPCCYAGLIVWPTACHTL